MTHTLEVSTQFFQAVIAANAPVSFVNDLYQVGDTVVLKERIWHEVLKDSEVCGQVTQLQNGFAKVEFHSVFL